MVKDYYKILNLPPEASEGTIKRQFRKMALRYHPDTNAGNPYADAWYREIQEAYQTLTDPRLRETYLQQRWLMKSMGKPLAPIQPLAPDFIYQTCKQYADKVSDMDMYRMSHLQVQEDILLLLTTERLDALRHYQHIGFNRKIIDCMLAATEILDYEFLAAIARLLFHIAQPDNEYREKIDKYLKKRRIQYLTGKYQVVLILLLTVALCGVIFFVGK